jgi:hydroxyethylthiazole kinase-like uncharacterized protein yjeF
MKVLTAAQMREVDRLTTERYGVPSIVLMENAAKATIEAAEKRFGVMAGKRALIICGKGNNGGDGAAIGRQLYARGARVDILLLGKIGDARGDARANFDAAHALAEKESTGESGSGGLRIVEIETPEALLREATSSSHDIVFDAIFGTGLTRPAAGIHADAIYFLKECSCSRPVVSVDIPSGIASDSDHLIGPAVTAHLTVTFTAPKPASVLPPACYHSGELVVAPIGSPEELIEESGSQLNLVGKATIESWLAKSRRSPDANKGDVGKILIVAGSRGKTGAACLAGAAAIRSGTGLATIATPQSSQGVVASQSPVECMTEPLPETPDGTASRDAAERILQLSGERDVLAIGPGLGSSDQSTREMVRSAIAARQRPVVIDADGLNCLAPWSDELRGTPELPVILTPHPGEMARLAGIKIGEVLQDRVHAASDFAARHSVILVLKGNRTLIAAPDGQVYVNPTGNAGMATGGTGDVLTGFIAGLLGQKIDDPLGAAIAGVYLHGLAGDIAASQIGARAMIASDITAHLCDAFMEAGGPAERLIR